MLRGNLLNTANMSDISLGTDLSGAGRERSRQCNPYSVAKHQLFGTHMTPVLLPSFALLSHRARNPTAVLSGLLLLGRQGESLQDKTLHLHPKAEKCFPALSVPAVGTHGSWVVIAGLVKGSTPAKPVASPAPVVTALRAAATPVPSEASSCIVPVMGPSLHGLQHPAIPSLGLQH